MKSDFTPTEVLEKLVVAAIDVKSLMVTNSLSKEIEFICRCNANKAPIRFLMACLLAKIHQPKIDIRKPYTEVGGDDAFSGRFYDEKYIEPIVHELKLPCNTTTAFLTPAFRNHDRLLTKELVFVGRPKEVYVFVLDILDAVQFGRENPERLLLQILRFLWIIKSENERRMDELLADLSNDKAALPLAAEDILTLIAQHLSARGTSRLPVLMIAAAYQTVKSRIGETNRSLSSHNAADKQTGTIGDIEITSLSDEQILTCYEMKDKKVSKTDIDLAVLKIANHQTSINNYIFITTELIGKEVAEYAKSIYERIGVEFVILDCLGFIRHFLHFFHPDRVAFLNVYQSLVLAEPTSAVSQQLKEAFLALRRAAEADQA